MIKLSPVNVKWILFSVLLLFAPSLIFGGLFAAIIPSVLILGFAVLAAIGAVIGQLADLIIAGIGLAYFAFYSWLYYVLSRQMSKKIFELRERFNPGLTTVVVGVLIFLISFLKVFIICGHECTKSVNIVGLWKLRGGSF
jgi:hypothetical protein